MYGGSDGGSLQDGEQFLLTEDSVQVVDLLIVRSRLAFAVVLITDVWCRPQDNLDDGDHPFHLHGHRPWMCVPCFPFGREE